MRSLVEVTESIQKINIIRHLLRDDGQFPNNARLPLLVYKGVLHVTALGDEAGKVVKEIFESNGWTDSWEDGIYDYHHYHSTAHEVLGIVKGSALVQFGGPSGVSVALEPGDLVIIPAGVAHKNTTSDKDFTCVGAYPEGQKYDMNYGKDKERPKADENIRKLPLPETDPVYGVNGPLIKNWSSNTRKVSEDL
jgi:uncharacterized protein YjlB